MVIDVRHIHVQLLLLLPHPQSHASRARPTVDRASDKARWDGRQLAPPSTTRADVGGQLVQAKQALSRRVWRQLATEKGRRFQERGGSGPTRTRRIEMAEAPSDDALDCHLFALGGHFALNVRRAASRALLGEGLSLRVADGDPCRAIGRARETEAVQLVHGDAILPPYKLRPRPKTKVLQYECAAVMACLTDPLLLLETSRPAQWASTMPSCE